MTISIISPRERLRGIDITPELKLTGWKLASVACDDINDVLENPELNAFMSKGNDLLFDVSENEFDGHDEALIEVRVSEMRAKGKKVFDAPKARMASDPRIGCRTSLERTSYFRGVVTNEYALGDIDYADGRKENGTDIAFPRGVVPSLADSTMSNHIGTAALALDKNGEVLICISGNASAVSANKLAPSSAGSCDMEDFVVSDNLSDVAKKTLERELREEAGLTGDVKLTTRLIALHRNLERGAKPDFIGLISVDGYWDDIMGDLSTEEAQFTSGHLKIDLAKVGTEGLLAWRDANKDRIGYALNCTIHALINDMKTPGSASQEWLAKVSAA